MLFLSTGKTFCQLFHAVGRIECDPVCRSLYLSVVIIPSFEWFLCVTMVHIVIAIFCEFVEVESNASDIDGVVYGTSLNVFPLLEVG